MTRGRRRRTSGGDEPRLGGLLLAASATVGSAGPPSYRVDEGADEDEPLLWSPLNGRPLLAWSLQALLRLEALAELVVLVDPGRELAASELVGALDPGHRLVRVRSYPDRHGALELGLAELSKGCRLVVIQEASRPLVTPQSLLRGIQVAQSHPDCGAVAYLPVRETIKRAEGGVVVGTLPRERLVLLQTPQMFPLALLRRAYKEALWSTDSTEEAVVAPVTAALSAGMRLIPFETQRDDILVAGPEDLPRAELLLRNRAS
jgi:2-C-methyl-D-erythritol 4-phosphate cytidylyltransferase